MLSWARTFFINEQTTPRLTTPGFSRVASKVMEASVADALALQVRRKSGGRGSPA
jgi:hypothetical protein